MTTVSEEQKVNSLKLGACPTSKSALQSVILRLISVGIQIFENVYYIIIAIFSC